MTSQPVYSTPLQQALSLLPHISPPEMKVLISAAKAQWAPRFSNEILADSFRYLSRKTLTEKICPVNSRYFWICVNSVPNVHNISMIGVDSFSEEDPTLHLTIPYMYCYDTEKGRCTDGEHRIALDDFPHSAPFLRFGIVSIRTNIFASKICEFFRRHRQSFSQCELLKMDDLCFESKSVLAESDVQLCGLLVDVFKSCEQVTIRTHYRNAHARNSDIFRDDQKLNDDDKTVGIPEESFAVLLFEKVRKVFKSMTMETEFCVSLIYRPYEIRVLHNNVFTVENDATQQQLLLFTYTFLYGHCHNDVDHPPEELRMWCRKMKPNDVKVMSCMDETSALLLQKEYESLYTDIGYWDLVN